MSIGSTRNLFEGTFTQILAAITCCLPMISDGMQYGWSAPVLPLLLGDNPPLKATKRQTELLETLYIVGAICGVTVTIYLVDKIGRKKSIILASTTTLVVWIVMATSTNIEFILAARFFTGMAGDMAFVAAPMYLAEIADQKIRGLLSATIYVMMLAGILLIYALVPYVPFYLPSVIGIVINVIGIVSFIFMPDSPYYLLITDKPEKAKRALIKLRQTNDVEKELEEISEGVAREKNDRGRPQDLILVKSNRKAMIIMTVLNAAQHMGCISVIIMNLHVILEAAGSIYIVSDIAAIIFSALMLISALVASFSIDKYGRKVLLIISNILTGMCLLTIAIYFLLKYKEVDVLSVSWIPIVSVMLYALVFKFGLGLVPIVLTAELFPSNVKALGMTLADVMYVTFALISLELYQWLTDSYGIHVPFFLFSVCCFITAVYTYFFIPETKGKTLDQIQFLLRGEPYPEPSNKRENIKYSEVAKSA